jgi:hypothetical protein
MITIAPVPLPLHSHEFKQTKLIAEAFKPSLLSRHIQWLREGQTGWKKVCTIVWMIFAAQALIVSVAGWIVLYQAVQEMRRQEARAAFFRDVEQIKPPSDDPIELKSQTRAFNHVQDFAIENGVIWTRLRHHYDKWRPIFFDGFAEGRIPKELDCDGANLVVLDDQNFFHYKKVLREFRHTEISEVNRDRFIRAGVDLDKDTYIAIDKSERDNWKDKWFSLPYINQIVNLFIERRLRLPHSAKAWAISHRGRYNNYLEDKVQQRHHVGVGTTTLYILDGKSRDIYKYDPWSPKYLKITIPLPETSEMFFEGENIDASASTIMAIGYEIYKNNPQKRTLQIYTCLADMDSKGWNPFYKYDYFKHSDDSDVIVIPLPDWKAHPLELNEGDFVTKEIEILQTGEGNDARQLRIPGQHQGRKGIYFKKINEQKWHFESLKDELAKAITKEKALPLEQENKEAFQTTVHNYEGQSVRLQGIPPMPISARLMNYGLRSYHSTLIVKLQNMTYELELHRRKTLKNFIGFEGDYYEMVVPEKLHQEAQLMQVLKGQKVIPVHISENQNKLTLEDRKTNCFKLTFSRIPS